jgi:SWIM zinc finger
VPDRWSAEQVLALAPDAASQKAGRGLGSPGPWRDTGCSDDPAALWGLCRGSGANPYQTCVDLTGPAYRCSCPSRKFPCKHALGLMLLWSAGSVAAGPAPAWVTEWLDSREERKRRSPGPSAPPSPKAADPATQARRAKRVDAGVAELERWLADQVRQGLAAASRAGYAHFDTMAARLVDAQAPGLAGSVRRLASVASRPDRLFAEVGLLWLLVRGYQRLDELPEPLAATVRGRVGFPVSTADVLAGPPVRDEWAVVGARDEADERLTARRVWLRGSAGRHALVLSFAPAGTPLPADLVPGTIIEAELCFYPAAQPLRALVAQRHGEPRPLGTPPAGSIDDALREYAGAVAAEPWLDRWPMLLSGVTPVQRDGWHLVDASGAALPLWTDPDTIWRVVAACGGAPATVAGEWSPAGLRPVTLWVEGRLIRP